MLNPARRLICIVVLAMLSLLFSACSSLILGSPLSTPPGGAGYETPPQSEYQRCIHSDYTDECDQQKETFRHLQIMGVLVKLNQCSAPVTPG